MSLRLNRGYVASGCLLVLTAISGCSTIETSFDRSIEPDPPADTESVATRKSDLGHAIYLDESLSTPVGTACASCHWPERGFADPEPGATFSEGAVDGRFGKRNTPMVSYASFSPPLHYDSVDETYAGGLFWDGRADSLSDQALGPLFNPLEMNNASSAELAAKIREASYAAELSTLYGREVLDDDNATVGAITDAIAAFERSASVNAFSSKFDAWIRGEAELTPQQLRGYRLFNDPTKGNCAACHASNPPDDGPAHALFTDFSYANVGIPKNTQGPPHTPPELDPAGRETVDNGLGRTVGDPAASGQFKVPSLRNVAATPPYGHNGYFVSLREIVDFHDTRDVDPKWSAPEVPENVDDQELGNLGLTDDEVDDIVAFLGTLTDGFVVHE